MMKFLSISNRDSKDAITLFSAIMNEIYKINTVNREMILRAIATELNKQGITSEKLKTDLKTIDA